MLLSFKIDLNKLETLIAPTVIIVSAFVVSRVVKFLLHRYIRRSSKVLNVDPTNYAFLQNAVSMIVFLVAVFFVVWNIPPLHDLGRTLFAGAGILAAIVGFASQEAFSNIITGIFIVIYKPFSVGDSIKLLSNGQSGVVEDITLRHTVLRGNENRRIVIPNSVISREQILNSTLKDQRIRLYLDIMITYDSDHNKAIDIIREESIKNPLFTDSRTPNEKMEGADPLPVRIISLEDKGVHLRAFIWVQNDDASVKVKHELLKVIKERFKASGIVFAHDYQFEPPIVLAK